MTPEDRLAKLGLTLPPPAAAVANYVPWAITGNLIMTSGNLPWRDGVVAFTGRIGRELTGEQGYFACQLGCLNSIAQLREAAGSLSRIKRVVRLEGTLAVQEGFEGHPKCLNGASDLLNTVFEERGAHTRMISTNPVMPLNSTCLIVLYAELET
jgi:enamine deaminase RidA (YjgF/YER057c/UK114 family)